MKITPDLMAALIHRGWSIIGIVNDGETFASKLILLHQEPDRYTRQEVDFSREHDW